MKKDICICLMCVLPAVGLIAFLFWGGRYPALALASADERPDLIVGLSSLPENLRPSEITNTLNRTKLIFLDHLIRRDYGATPEGDGSQLVPSLAESWKCDRADRLGDQDPQGGEVSQRGGDVCRGCGLFLFGRAVLGPQRDGARRQALLQGAEEGRSRRSPHRPV